MLVLVDVSVKDGEVISYEATTLENIIMKLTSSALRKAVSGLFRND